MAMFEVALLLVSWCAGALTQPPQYYDLDNAHIHFEEFVNKFEKTYSSEHERRYRFHVFKVNLENVNKLNTEENASVLGINYFMDLTQAEFVKTYTGLRDADDGTHCDVQTDSDISDENVPDSFDWREKHAVTRVKNQGQCGCCWAFSAAGVLEGQYAIHHGKLLQLSEQQLIDCDCRSVGCCGGYPGSAIRSAIAQGGIMREHDYQFIADKRMCSVEKNMIVATVKRCLSWNITSQEKVKRLLYMNGPISIGITGQGLMYYKSGILSDAQCVKGDINHAVLLVGYGKENGQPYWIVKNSWGEQFGESGYFRMVRGEGKQSCAMQVSFMTTAELE